MAVLNLLVDDVVVKSFPLEKSGTTIGRSPDCDIQIEESAVSAKHARIEMIPNPIMEELTEIYIEDQGTMNGTYVNDVLVGRIASGEWRSRAFALSYLVGFGVSALSLPLIAWIHGSWGFSMLFGLLAGAALLIFVVVLYLPQTETASWSK